MKVTVLNNTEVNLVSGGDVGNHDNYSYTGSPFGKEPALIKFPLSAVVEIAAFGSLFTFGIQSAFSGIGGSIYHVFPRHFR
jgi:hypothetical protein